MDNKEFVALLKSAMQEQKLDTVKPIKEKVKMPDPPEMNLPNAGIKMPKVQAGSISSITPASTASLWSPNGKKGLS